MVAVDNIEQGHFKIDGKEISDNGGEVIYRKYTDGTEYNPLGIKPFGDADGQ